MSGMEWPDLIPALSAQLARPYGIAFDRVRTLKISESATFLAGDGSQRVVVRVYRADRHSASTIHSELAWIEALHHDGFPTPAVIRTKAGELTTRIDCPDGVQRICALFEFVAEDDHVPDLRQTFHAIGAACGRLQNHGESWRSREEIERGDWDLEATMAESTPWGGWTALPLSAHDRRTLEDARDHITRTLPPFARDTAVLAHADLKPVNSIWAGDRLMVIDFDDCGFGWYMYDFGTAVSFFEDDPAVPSWQDAWTAGFRTRRELPASDEQMLPSFVLLRRLLLLAWMGSHSHSRESRAMSVTYSAGSCALAETYLSSNGRRLF